MLPHPMIFGCTSRRWLMISRSVNLVSPMPSCRQRLQHLLVHVVLKAKNTHSVCVDQPRTKLQRRVHDGATATRDCDLRPQCWSATA